MERSTELILGELTKHLGRKHLNSELVKIANDLSTILERNGELKQCNIADVRLSLLNKVKEIAFGDGSAQERMVDIKALFSNEA